MSTFHQTRYYYSLALDRYLNTLIHHDTDNHNFNKFSRESIIFLDHALKLCPDFEEAGLLREEIWHMFLKASNEKYQENYRDYLNSPAWYKKRDAVMKRDGHKCAACGSLAKHVHHKTYDNIGKEPLADLVAVCDVCHPKMDEMREARISSDSTNGTQPVPQNRTPRIPADQQLAAPQNNPFIEAAKKDIVLREDKDYEF